METHKNNLTLDDSHHYFLDGRRIIGTTEALSLLDGRRKDPWYLLRGQYIHKATKLYDLDDLDESSVDSGIQGFLNGYIKFRKETDFDPVYIEHSFYHPQYLYGCTLDRLGPLNKHWALIDLKSGAKAKVDELQEVAYWEAAKANKLPVEKLFDLYLKENGTYKLEPVERPRNLLPVFLACLTAVRWREGL